jgi:hypothetical protein
MTKSREIEFRVGRRSTDGLVKLSPYPPALLQLSVSYKGERSASVVLTREQIQALREALAEFEKDMPHADEITGTWDQRERRLEESILVSADTNTGN